MKRKKTKKRRIVEAIRRGAEGLSEVVKQTSSDQSKKRGEQRQKCGGC